MNYSIFFSLYSLAHRSKFLDWLIVFSANWLPIFMIAVAVFFLFFHHDGSFNYRKPFLQIRNKTKEITFVFSSTVAAYILAFIIKTVTEAPRPFVIFKTVKPLFLEVPMHSFPSGHATLFAALTVALFMRHKKMGIIFTIATVVICLARVAAGVHFPIDILGGLIIGTAISLLLNNFFLPNVYKK